MSHAAELIERTAAELRGIGASLVAPFAAAAGPMEGHLEPDALREWARIGLGLARLSPRSSAVAAAFFEASPAVGERGIAFLSVWAEIAVGLADRAPQAAAAFIEATPDALARLEPEELEQWAGRGRRLIRGGWKSSKLAEDFFRIGPELLEWLPLRGVDRLVDIVERVSRRSHEMGSLCLHDAPELLARLASADREPFLAFTQAVCNAAWVDAHRCFEHGPALLELVRPDQRSGLLDLAATAAAEVGSEAFSLFATAAEALARLDSADQAEVIEFGRRLTPHGARVAIASLVSAPDVRERLTSVQARRWSEAGLELLATPGAGERAESYFRLESALAEEMLEELTPRVELGSVSGVLRLYAKALSGAQVLVYPTGTLAGRNIGWVAEVATTDGLSVFLPPAVEIFGDEYANFQVYKVYTTHQVARLEFGSFDYRFGVDGEHLSSTALDRERRVRDRPSVVEPPSLPAVTPMQRLLDLFDDRRLASKLFALAEDTRIDACIESEYPGVRLWLRRLQKHEAEQRPDVQQMVLRRAFVENLLRASLGHPETIHWPERLAARLERAVAALRLVEREGATVQDSAEVTGLLYDLAMSFPNLPPKLVTGEWGGIDEDAVARVSVPSDVVVQPGEELPEVEEDPSPSSEQPAYRGDFKPELVQLLDELTERERSTENGVQLTREQILELLEKSSEIELADESDDEPQDLEALLDNLEEEAAERAKGDEEEDDDEPGETIEWFLYDEWDYRANDYRPGWCRVGERVAAEGDGNFYEETLNRYHGLVVETRRQFERMRPESFRLLKRLEDGHEIDLDRAIEFRAEKKAGVGPLARFYTRRNKARRDVAVAFLLDMSGSTSEEIPAPPLGPAGSVAPVKRQVGGVPANGEKRIIDVERESTVLVVEALEAIGDAYGIYGFSGHGRENVEFHVIKDLGESLDESVRRRIAKIEPIQSTRMGPAIRHTIAKLNDHDARVKILILVSDGRPQDEEYGRERGEKEYAVHDTKRALLEAKRQRITPFLITVDSAGHDYLRHLCDDIGYELVADIESLPRRLPRLYRHLAAE